MIHVGDERNGVEAYAPSGSGEEAGVFSGGGSFDEERSPGRGVTQLDFVSYDLTFLRWRIRTATSCFCFLVPKRDAWKPRCRNICTAGVDTAASIYMETTGFSL